MTEPNAVLLHVDEIEARYEENRQRRADGWRSMDDIPWLMEWVRTLSKDLAELRQTCTCGATYATFEGPEPDCPVHGAVRALNEITREREQCVAHIAAAWAVLRDGRDEAGRVDAQTVMQALGGNWPVVAGGEAPGCGASSNPRRYGSGEAER